MVCAKSFQPNAESLSICKMSVSVEVSCQGLAYRERGRWCFLFYISIVPDQPQPLICGLWSPTRRPIPVYFGALADKLITIENPIDSGYKIASFKITGILLLKNESLAL
jgi:hypothetical protein